MDVCIEGHEGLPDGGLVSIRIGSTRRQAPLSSLYTSPLRFPPFDETSFEPLKIDVLLPIASARLVLQPNMSHYKISFDSEGKTGWSCLGLGIQRKKAELAPEVRPSSVSPMQPQNATAVAKDYLEEHGVLRYVQGLLHAIMQVRPDDPYEFMIKQLNSVVRSPPGQGAPAGGSSPPAAAEPAVVEHIAEAPAAEVCSRAAKTGAAGRSAMHAPALLAEASPQMSPSPAMEPSASGDASLHVKPPLGAEPCPLEGPAEVAEKVNELPRDDIGHEPQSSEDVLNHMRAAEGPAEVAERVNELTAPSRDVIGHEHQSSDDLNHVRAADGPAEVSERVKELHVPPRDVTGHEHQSSDVLSHVRAAEAALSNALPERPVPPQAPTLSPSPPSEAPPHLSRTPSEPGRLAVAGGCAESHAEPVAVADAKALSDPSAAVVRASLEEAVANGSLEKALIAANALSAAKPLDHPEDHVLSSLRASLEEAAESGQLHSLLSVSNQSGMVDEQTCAHRVRRVLGQALLAGDLQRALAEYAPPAQRKKLPVREVTMFPLEDRMGEHGHDGWAAALEMATMTTSCCPEAKASRCSGREELDVHNQVRCVLEPAGKSGKLLQHMSDMDSPGTVSSPALAAAPTSMSESPYRGTDLCVARASAVEATCPKGHALVELKSDTCCQSAATEAPPQLPPAAPLPAAPPPDAAPQIRDLSGSVLKTGASLNDLKDRMRTMLERAAETGELEGTLVELTPSV